MYPLFCNLQIIFVASCAFSFAGLCSVWMPFFWSSHAFRIHDFIVLLDMNSLFYNCANHIWKHRILLFAVKLVDSMVDNWSVGVLHFSYKECLWFLESTSLFMEEKCKDIFLVWNVRQNFYAPEVVHLHFIHFYLHV